MNIKNFCRKAYILFAAVVLFAVIPNNVSAQDQAAEIAKTTLVKVGDKAADFTVEMLDGKQITLSKLKGKVVLVNFWATWCPPCREELKHVQKEIIDRFKGKDLYIQYQTYLRKVNLQLLQRIQRSYRNTVQQLPFCFQVMIFYY